MLQLSHVENLEAILLNACSSYLPYSNRPILVIADDKTFIVGENNDIHMAKIVSG